MGYRLDDRGVRVLFSAGKSNFLSSTSSRPALRLTQCPVKWVPGTLSPGVKQLGHEGDQSPPSIAKIKNGGTIP
jgi:hypothetical protein